MGTDGVGPGTENMGPAHTVKLPDFRLDVTEVTVAAYRACVNAGGCTAARRSIDGVYREHCTWDVAGVDTDPINCVTWIQADVYCKWAGKELPTEEQWEYAARGKTGRDFPWGMAIRGHDNWGAPDDVITYVRGCDIDWRATCPVGSAPKGNTPEGVKDMAGNVAEWTASIYCKYDNPRCGGEERALRGDSNTSAGQRLVGTFRGGVDPGEARDNIGFRCAQPVEKGKAP
jgi:formylglycine-generating enzyme required for sulfatase activity